MTDIESQLQKAICAQMLGQERLKNMNREKEQNEIHVHGKMQEQVKEQTRDLNEMKGTI